VKRLSPGTVIASIALAVALGGTGYAAIVLPADSVGTRQVIDGSLLRRDFKAGQLPAAPAGPPATKLWAVVNPSGSLARSNGTTSAGRVVEGGYEVLFTQDVSRCTYVATVGNQETGNPPFGVIAVAQRTGNVNGVYVETRDLSGALVDRPFHLAVLC